MAWTKVSTREQITPASHRFTRTRRVWILLYLGIFLTGYFPAPGQKAPQVTFTGTVLDAKTGETLPQVVVHIPELDQWTTSNRKGVFSFKDIQAGTYTVMASCLGYNDYEKKITLSRNVNNYKLRMDEHSLALAEVTVTAQSGGKINSSSTLHKTAIEHLQATSLTDIMQLLPGVLTFNPSLTKINQIAIRDVPPILQGTANPTMTTALGTAIIVNGANLSNDANLQTAMLNIAFQTCSQGGMDTRQIPINSIESVEVIRGVASAEYGDLTSGAVLVRTKAGKSPFEITFKTDPKLKMVSTGKGIDLGKDNGFFNVDMEYAYSSKDNRTPSTTFNRLTVDLGYSNIFHANSTAFSFNAQLRGYMTLDKQKKDPDMQKEHLFKAEEKGIHVNLHGNWMLHKSWITTLKYTLAGSLGRQYNYEKTWLSGNIQPTTSATESGEHVGTFLPAQYFSTFQVEGKPVHLQGKLVAKLSGKRGSFYNTGMIGMEWNTKGNIGDGKRYGPYQPASGLRPRSFNDIPFIHEYSFFLEDRLTVLMGKQQRLEISAGTRVSNIHTKAVDYNPIIDPRFNARHVFVDRPWKKEGLQQLSLRTGWGIQHKMPTLYYLYPDPLYTDRQSFLYIHGDTTLAVFNTRVTPTDNPHLKMPRSTNFEIGMDVQFQGVTATVAYYRERLTDAFSTARHVQPFYWTRYKDLPFVTKPEYINGQVVHDGQVVETSQDSTFISSSRPGNGNRIRKWGIEYTLDFGMIHLIRTTLIADGAYMYQKKTDESLQMVDQSTTYHDYVGIYPGTTSNVDNGNINQRFNTNFRFITHLPTLKFIVSLNVQCVWMDKAQRTFSYPGKNTIYMKDGEGNIIPGDPGKDSEHYKYIRPLQYMDLQGNIHDFTENDATLPQFQTLILSSKPQFLMEDNPAPYFMLNLHLTKEIGPSTTFSFYANNLTNSSPKRYYRSTGTYQKMNPDIYFGAELKFKF